MILCDQCFHDEVIAGKIRNCSEMCGSCPTGQAEQAFLYDTDKQDDLTADFENFLSIYVPESKLQSSFPAEEKRLLVNDLTDRWGIFARISYDAKREILISICQELYRNNPELFDKPVGIAGLHDQDYIEHHHLLKYANWNTFVKEIKTVNRYHSDLADTNIFQQFCSYVRKHYEKGAVFYRARISDSREGFPPEEMSAPPEGRSSDGRANARGITCLYISNNVPTTLHEVRAAAFDYVTVGTFRLKQDIVVVNLKSLTKISPFIDDWEPLDHAINKQYLEQINLQMSKPLRRGESTLDYVPTQYVVDLIKSFEHDGVKEYAGVEYDSTISEDGYNLAIFNPNLFECESVEVLEVNNLEYSTTPIAALQ